MSFYIPESVKPEFAKLKGQVVKAAYVAEYEQGRIESVRIAFANGAYVEFFNDGRCGFSLDGAKLPDSPSE